MNLKPLLSTIAIFFLSLSTFGQNQNTEKKYKFMLKLVENNVWWSYYNEKPKAIALPDDVINNDVFKNELMQATLKHKSFRMGASPSFVIFTKRHNQIEIGLNAFLNFEKNANFDGKTLLAEKNRKWFEFDSRTNQVYIVPKNLPTKSIEKKRTLYTVLRTAYNFRLSNEDSKIVFLLGPSLNASRNTIYENSKLVDIRQGVIGFGLSSKLGYHAGKRMYVETALPFTFYKIERGMTNNEPYMIHTNYLKKLLNKTDYDRVFTLQFSVGYKL